MADLLDAPTDPLSSRLALLLGRDDNELA